MRFIFLLIKSSSSADNWSFHQAIYKTGAISIAQPFPLIYEFYKNTRQNFGDLRIFILHEKADLRMLQKYVPEIPLDNYFALEGDYDLIRQMEIVSDICTNFGDPFAPFVIIPINHVIFNNNSYFRAVDLCFRLAETSGNAFILGNKSNTHSLNYSVYDSGTVITNGQIEVAPVVKYLHNDLSIELRQDISFDCGILGWRVLPMKEYITRFKSTVNTSYKVDAFGELFTVIREFNLFVLKGEFGCFGIADPNIELRSYGSLDDKGNTYISHSTNNYEIALNDQLLDMALPKDDYEYIDDERRNKILLIINVLDGKPAFAPIVAILKSHLGLL